MDQMIEALRNGQQCDEDGVMCIVSRQACHEAADEIERLTGLLHAHGIDLGSEYICSCGIRREPKQKKPEF